jgi:5'-3' exonuclease
MGIPFYFSTISRDYDVKAKRLPIAEYLCFDYNCLIHTVAQHVNRNSKYKLVSYLHKAIFKEIKKYTKNIIEICNAKNIYISVDGVPPLAKMVQQRKRRYMSIFEKQYKSSVPDSLWNSSVVTPGTKFMNDFNVILTEFVNELNSNNINVTVSSWDEPGEGEHKIFTWLAQQNIKNNNIIIYGLDADMILLSLLHSEYKITLIRESRDVDISKPVMTDFDLVDINIILGLMSEKMGCKSTNDLDESILDYIFLTFLAGNDFLPSLSYIKVKKVHTKGRSGIDLLMDTYNELFKQKNKRIVSRKLVNGMHINFDTFKELLEKLSTTEDANMLEVYNNIRRVPPQHQNESETEYNWKYFPILDERYNEHKLVDPKTKSWQIIYNKKLFPNGILMEDVCRSYLEGLEWNIRYYLSNKAPIEEWCYDHCYSPNIQYLYKFMLNNSIEKQDFKKYKLNFKITPIMQLLAVIPPANIHIIPDKYHSIMTKGSLLRYMYPDKFKVHTWLKSVAWESYPLLPPINIKLLNTAVEKIVEVKKSNTRRKQKT